MSAYYTSASGLPYASMREPTERSVKSPTELAEEARERCAECVLMNRCKYTDGGEWVGHCREGRDTAPRERSREVSILEDVA